MRTHKVQLRPKPLWLIPVVLTVLLSAGCKREPDFEERYTAANREIVSKAKAIDTQVMSTNTPVSNENEAIPDE